MPIFLTSSPVRRWKRLAGVFARHEYAGHRSTRQTGSHNTKSRHNTKQPLKQNLKVTKHNYKPRAWEQTSRFSNSITLVWITRPLPSSLLSLLPLPASPTAPLSPLSLYIFISYDTVLWHCSSTPSFITIFSSTSDLGNTAGQCGLGHRPII